MSRRAEKNRISLVRRKAQIGWYGADNSGSCLLYGALLVLTEEM
jgi:hypothetical protein